MHFRYIWTPQGPIPVPVSHGASLAPYMQGVVTGDPRLRVGGAIFGAADPAAAQAALAATQAGLQAAQGIAAQAGGAASPYVQTGLQIAQGVTSAISSVASASAGTPPSRGGGKASASPVAGGGLRLGKALVLGARKSGVAVTASSIGKHLWLVAPKPAGLDGTAATHDVMTRALAALDRRFGPRPLSTPVEVPTVSGIFGSTGGKIATTVLGTAAGVTASIPVVGWIASAILGLSAGVVSAVDIAHENKKSKKAGKSQPTVRPGIALGSLMVGSTSTRVQPAAYKIAEGIYVIMPIRADDDPRKRERGVIGATHRNLTRQLRG